ncbi:SDR family oxidoreductase [Legionella jordanis]|uniref:SDR family NAD(P)-dependent oxidoreductase n=1 Tax=Legionella jordanis TaxID=456 RepID=UPI000EFF0891|nr:SDR family oxidoreductase [Legionella jordanis]RMX18346.1 SDR family oxidoreductase [Legionella jordanis]
MTYTLITGSSKGIGRALAFEFAKHGHDLILTARSREILEQLACDIRTQHGVAVEIIPLDLSQSKSPFELINIIAGKKYDIDCLVNNAGIGYLGDYKDMDSHLIQQMLQLNITTVSQLTRYFAKRFVDCKRGKILQLSSTAGFQPGPYMSVYYASKAYVTSFSVSLAYELKGTGVSLSILCPGPTQSHFFKEAHMEGSFLARGVLGLSSAEKVAEVAYESLQKNKLFIIPGFINKLLTYCATIAPLRLSRQITAFLHRK